jgi:mono/diheme cytochrome c family protein
MRRVLGTAVVLCALAAVLAGCGGSVGGGGTVDAADADLTNGKALFIERCGSCHTLADAGTQGKVGPNLDDAFAGARAQGFDEASFVDLVRTQIEYPGIGLGMPANLVTGKDADDVAAYVGRYGGNPAIPPSQPVPGQETGGGGGGGQTGAETGEGGGGGGEAADGEAIFSQNCASCHTLAAAGASGQVGPNLDELKPDEQTVATQVTNGGGGMPAFKDQLSDEQITAVAQFVAQNAGG